ncbi:hypothetical protein V1478_009940 [Vespula squamosa]|uniref:Uncharacterized protein n=1 Tax=Vespula squamosa TaxID=30214 RepID=A0ABD2AJV3_VESSQ
MKRRQTSYCIILESLCVGITFSEFDVLRRLPTPNFSRYREDEVINLHFINVLSNVERVR